MNKNNDIN
jgi:hypothetical protein